MIEPTQAQVDAALKVFASLWAEKWADNWEPLVRMAVRAALNAADDPVIDGAGWAEAAFTEMARHKQYAGLQYKTFSAVFNARPLSQIQVTPVEESA